MLFMIIHMKHPLQQLVILKPKPPYYQSTPKNTFCQFYRALLMVIVRKSAENSCPRQTTHFAAYLQSISFTL